MVLINIKITPQKRLFGRVFFFVDIFDCKNWYDFVFSLINEITFFRLKQKKVFYVPEKKFFLGNYIFLTQFYILLKVIKKNKVFFYFLSKKQNRTRSTQYVIKIINNKTPLLIASGGVQIRMAVKISEIYSEYVSFHIIIYM